MSWSKRIFLPMSGTSSESDPQGLAKRVACAFDQHPYICKIDTLCILQQGNKIGLLGKVDSPKCLAQVIEYAKQIEGVREVDISQVVVESPLELISVA